MKDHDAPGAANPYALAEIVAQHKIEWATVAEPQTLLRQILGRPYEELIDPRHESPLYPGFGLAPEGPAKPLKATPVAVLADPPSVVPTGGLKWKLTNTALPKLLHKLVLPTEVGESAASQPWTPPNGASWSDVGRFFSEAAEVSDPQQGAIGNCYFVAALSSVAWTRPELLVHSTQPSGPENDDFVCLIRFTKAPNKNIGGKNRATATVKVTERVPMTSNGLYIYCRSAEAGEVWPAIYEKAYAKWLTENTTDQPEITKTANGSIPSRAVSQVSGFQTITNHAPRNMTNTQLWDFVMAETNGGSNANFGATRFPMVAATVDTAAETVNGKAFSGDVVANHAYSLLGLATMAGTRSVVLRNPWGRNTPSDLTNAGVGRVWNARVYPDWTQRVRLDRNGIFTLSLDAFRNYFEVISLVKP